VLKLEVSGWSPNLATQTFHCSGHLSEMLSPLGSSYAPPHGPQLSFNMAAWFKESLAYIVCKDMLHAEADTPWLYHIVSQPISSSSCFQGKNICDPWSLLTRRPTSPNVALQISKTYFAQINFCNADLETVLGIQWLERHARSHRVIPRTLSCNSQRCSISLTWWISRLRIQENPRHSILYSTPVLLCLPPKSLTLSGEANWCPS